MEFFAKAILHHKKTVLTIFIILVTLGIVMSFSVKTNYSLSDYLPLDAPSTKALEVMENEFSGNMPNLSLYMPDVSIAQALEIKRDILSIQGITGCMWLDDVTDVYVPLEMIDPAVIESWYQDGGALYSITIGAGDQILGNMRALQAYLDGRGILVGDAMNQFLMQKATGEELTKIVIILAPMVLLILFIATSSWLEPILFVLAIGVAILINMGSNIFLGEISFVTSATAAILQLAVSLDYAVFLLHTFEKNRKKGLDVETSMVKAMLASFSSIAASAVTTILGFAVLVLMRFRIGPDMGIVLAKGIVFSFLTVIVLLPVMTVYMSKLLEKTTHRSFMPSFKGLSKMVIKVCIPLCVVAVALVTVGFLGQRQSHFVYGSGGVLSEGSQGRQDLDAINEVFGQSNQLVLMVPNTNISLEEQLCQELDSLPYVNSVVSYANTVGAAIPSEVLPKSQISPLRSENYDRIIITVNTSDEGDDAFEAVQTIRNTAQVHYPDSYHLTGISVVNLDLRDTVVKDNKLVSIAILISIGLVLLVTFRSVSLPLILLFAIQGATWMNLSIPYFMGDTLNYLGYLIISTVQLGATVDYGIFFVGLYMDYRKTMNKRDAISKTIARAAQSILPPAAVLATAGFSLGFISTNAIISQLGAVLGKGAVLSTVMVLFVLPGLLLIFDKVIAKTTLKNIHMEEI